MAVVFAAPLAACDVVEATLLCACYTASIIAMPLNVFIAKPFSDWAVAHLTSLGDQNFCSIVSVTVQRLVKL